ncbi:YceI family protein [Puia dinghuensis]|uniref:Polyisoprenoid-binding protein n=1 Tax=Puia dinghuensis TaxID=1792502 RepID=A0A8J2U836_9BACT|nr:YceI family protein [Puia dinghuensis]GGA85381.1 polyisoprenoid-binding protein [Puia dinghuensis]
MRTAALQILPGLLLDSVLLLALFIATPVKAQYQPLDKGSSVQFRIKNLGFNVTGSLTGLVGKISFDPAQPGDAVFDVSVDANSINTDNDMRDDHLRKESYFNVKQYPRISLISGKISLYKRGAYLFAGRLTIKNHSQDVSFPFTATEIDGGYQFKGTFTINRKDFDVGGFSTISDNLDVTLDVIAK